MLQLNTEASDRRQSLTWRVCFVSRQLLLDCGIGVGSDVSSEPVVSQHRVLLFCQLKSMLNIVENDLLK